MSKSQQGKEKTCFNFKLEFCEEQVFTYLFPKGKFDYKAPQDIPISPA